MMWDGRAHKCPAVQNVDHRLAFNTNLSTERGRAAGFRQLRLIRRGQNCDQDFRLSLDGFGNCQFEGSCQSLRSGEHRTDRTLFSIVRIGVVGRFLSRH